MLYVCIVLFAQCCIDTGMVCAVRLFVPFSVPRYLSHKLTAQCVLRSISFNITLKLTALCEAFNII